jgi:hypothetical protein
MPSKVLLGEPRVLISWECAMCSAESATGSLSQSRLGPNCGPDCVEAWAACMIVASAVI